MWVGFQRSVKGEEQKGMGYYYIQYNLLCLFLKSRKVLHLLFNHTLSYVVSFSLLFSPPLLKTDKDSNVKEQEVHVKMVHFKRALISYNNVDHLK